MLSPCLSCWPQPGSRYWKELSFFRVWDSSYAPSSSQHKGLWKLLSTHPKHKAMIPAASRVPEPGLCPRWELLQAPGLCAGPLALCCLLLL